MNKKSGSKRPQGNGRRRPGRREEDMATKIRQDEVCDPRTSKPNDWRWYAQNEQLLKDAASFPYSYPLGNRLNLGGDVAIDVNKGSVPGIMAIHTAPTFGWADNPNSPINVAARNIYSYVRHANSGHANYDAPDLMLYLCAMDNLYSYIAYLKRIYGVVATYSYTNRYYPKAIVEAMGVNFSHVQSNLADFRAAINVMAVKVGSMCVPASMSYFAKHMWMYDGYYLDGDQDKAQTYMFVPDGFFVYSLNGDGAGMLDYSPLPYAAGSNKPTMVDESDLLTTHQLIEYGNTLLDPILSSEDMNIMSGDILKAFGSGELYKVDGISETYTVLPSYDTEVLQQIENLSLIGSFADDHAVLLQDTSVGGGFLIFTPSFQHPYAFPSEVATHPGYNVFLANNFINFHHGDVTPADTMEASRMSNIAHEVNYEDNTLTYHTFGSEVAMYAYIYYYSDWSGTWTLTRSRTLYKGNTGVVSFNTSVSQIPMSITGSAYATSGASNACTEVSIRGSEVINLPLASVNTNTAVSEIMEVFLLAEQLSNFDWHPAMSLTLGIHGTTINPTLDAITLRINPNPKGCVDSDPSTLYTGETTLTPSTDTWFVDAPVYGRFNGLLFDLAYYTVVNEEDLKQMAEVALLSEFNVRQLGRA